MLLKTKVWIEHRGQREYEKLGTGEVLYGGDPYWMWAPTLKREIRARLRRHRKRRRGKAR
jgi:hypothetical protein